MEEYKKIGFDLSQIAAAFNIKRQTSCEHLQNWIKSSFDFSEQEMQFLNRLYTEIAEDSDYWNEEELKVKGVGLLFFLADIQVKEKIKVFYERPIQEVVNGYALAVITDCMVAATLEFNSPKAPYFFLQEFKKKRGEKKDPEAQMLTAMLIAQAKNQDEKPIYGGFLIGGNWRFTTLIGTNYCISRQFDATQFEDLRQIVFILRKLKELILTR